MPLNSLEHGICTTSLTDIRPGLDSNPVLRATTVANEPSGPARLGMMDTTETRMNMTREGVNSGQLGSLILCPHQ